MGLSFLRSALLCGGFILALGAALGVRAQSAPDQTEKASRQVVQVVAERFLFTPSEITVAAGTSLELRISSADTDHGFRILGTDLEARVPKRGRGEATLMFEANEPGDFTFECSHMCGAGHSFMRGRIRVRPRASHASEVASQP